MVAKPDTLVQAPDGGAGEAVLDEVSFAWLDDYASDEAPRRENEAAVTRAFEILSAIAHRK